MFDYSSLVELPRSDTSPEISPEDLIEELESLFRQRDRLEARISALVGRVDETGAYRRDGYSSVTALLKDQMLLHPGEASRFVHRGNGLRDASGTSLVYARGDLSGAQVDVLLYGSAVAPEAFRCAEEALVACRQNSGGVSPALEAPGFVLVLDAATAAPSSCVLAR